MPKFKMKVLPSEPDQKINTILIKSKALPQKIREEPYIIGNSDHDYTCGLCDRILLKSVTPEEVREITYQCSNCGSYNILAYLRAYVMINVESGTEEDVLNNLESVREVKKAHLIYGVYDIIAVIESKSMQGLHNAIRYKIRQLKNVRSTTTMISVE